MAQFDFHVIWLDSDGKAIRRDHYFSQTITKVIEKAGRRLHQSPHLTPQNSAGFYVMYDAEFRKRIGEELDAKDFTLGDFELERRKELYPELFEDDLKT